VIYFDIGETVLCSVESRKGGNLTDPDSLQITIYDPDGTEDVSLTGMSRDSEGKWHYDYQTSGKSKGFYRAQIKSTDGARITLINGGFKLR